MAIDDLSQWIVNVTDEYRHAQKRILTKNDVKQEFCELIDLWVN